MVLAVSTVGKERFDEVSKDWAPGVGMPARLLLNRFGSYVFDAWNSHAYLVGSAARGKTWRDVDVRLILTDEEFEWHIGELTRPKALNPCWNANCLAWSYFGRSFTGLPIDFQIDQQSQANEQYPSEVRLPLFDLDGTQSPKKC